MWIIYCSYFKYVVILYSTDTDIAWVIYFLFLENLCFLPSMVGSRNGFSKLVLAIMRGRGRVQAGSRTTLPTRLTTLNISHCITITHTADTNTDNHTTLYFIVCMFMPNHNFKISLLFALTSNKFYIFKGVKNWVKMG